MGVLTQEQLADVLFGVREFVDNPKSPHVLDRRQMPGLSMAQKWKKTVPFINNKLTIKYKSEVDELDMQIWNGLDELGFQEFRTGFDLTFTGTQLHVGMKFPHQELKDSGFTIIPNAARNQNFASSMSRTEGLRLFDTLKEKMESAFDRYDIIVDQKLLHNVSGNAEEPTAFTDLISKTPTVGTFGGRDRSDAQMQNPVVLNSTNSSFERDMNGLFRQAMLYNRGFKGAGIDVIRASGGWIDRMNDATRDVSQGYRLNADIKSAGGIDIGIPDTDWKFNRTPVVYDPTMDLMAELTGDESWNRRAYGINTKTMVWGIGESEDKLVTFPDDPHNQRVTRGSIDTRYMLYCINPRSNFVHEFAA